MRDILAIEKVFERDVDLLVLEELHVSEPFRRWLIEKVIGPDLGLGRFVGAWHSVPSLRVSSLSPAFRPLRLEQLVRQTKPTGSYMSL